LTLAEVLSQAGFDTAAFTTNKLLVPESGIAQGFARFTTDFGEERDERMLSAARDWIETHDVNGGRPCFVWVHLMGPHLPYAPPPLEGLDYAGLFADPSYHGPASGSREFTDAVHAEQRELSAADVQRVIDLYDGEVARIDALVSRFLRDLDQK